MRIFLPVLFLFFSSAAIAQTATTQAAAAGCGASEIKFDVKTDSSNHPLAKPDPGKALIYFLQDDANFQSIPRPTTRFGVDGSWVGATHANSYFYISVDPGEHHICAGWQSFVGFTDGQKSAAAHFTAVAGASYFYLVQNHGGGKYQTQQAGMDFSLLDSDEAQLRMAKLAFSISRPKK